MAQREHVPDMAKIYAALGPGRERRDLATVTAVMERLVAAVRDDEPAFGRVGAAEFAWCGSDDPVELLMGEPSAPEIPPRAKRGRPPADCYIALLVAVAFHRFTGEPPTRKWNGRKRMETSDFYVWVEVVFPELFGRTAPWTALDEACERWERSRGFSKRNMRKLLFGGPKPKKRVRPDSASLPTITASISTITAGT
jgi:hypothetical protein